MMNKKCLTGIEIPLPTPDPCDGAGLKTSCVFSNTPFPELGLGEGATQDQINQAFYQNAATEFEQVNANWDAVEGPAEILNKPTAFPPESHTHTIDDISQLQDELDDKAPLTHSHVISDVTGLQGELENKSDVNHTHTTSQITDFPTFKTIENQSIIGTGNIDLDKTSVGLGNVDNTSDANKPISTATQSALNGKEPTIPTGTASQYIKGDKTLGTFPTVDQTIINGSTNAVSSNAVFDGLASKKNKALAITTEPAITKTLAATDECIVFTNANPVAFTIPTNASVPIPIGTEVQYVQQGDGVVTVGGAGITFVTNLALSMVKGETRTLTKIGTDTWTVEGKEVTSVNDNFNFNVNTKYRAWQGIGVFDSNYIYVCSDRNSSFGLNNSIQKYDHKGNFISEVTSAYTQLDPQGKFMSFGSLISDDGTYFIIPTYNYNSNGSPLISRIARFNKTTLAYVDQFSIGGNVAEAAYLYGGEWYVCYFDIMKIRKFNTSWVLQAEYNLSPSLKPNGGYQSLFYKDGYWYMNWHGSNNYNGIYAPGLDKYTFDGTNFSYVETITAPTYGSGQGVTFFNNKYYWIDRPNNAVVVTNKLGDIFPQNLMPTFKNITVEDPLNVDKLDATTLTAVDKFYLGTNYVVTIGAQGEFQLQRVAGASPNSVMRLLGGTSSDTQIIHATSTGNKFLEGYDESPVSGFRLYHYGLLKPVIFSPYANDRIGLNGVTEPKSSLEIGGGIKIANDSDVATADKVGTLRYRASLNNSYIDMCMQTGASTYAWINIITQTW